MRLYDVQPQDHLLAHRHFDEAVRDRVARNHDRVRGIDERRILIAHAAADADTERQPHRRPEAARELRRQREAAPVERRVLALRFRIEVLQAEIQVPSRREPPDDAERHALDALLVVLVEDRRHGARVHDEDDVLVHGVEVGAAQEQPARREFPLRADFVVRGLLRIDVRVVLVRGPGVQLEVRGSGRRERRSVRRVDVPGLVQSIDDAGFAADESVLALEIRDHAGCGNGVRRRVVGLDADTAVDADAAPEIEAVEGVHGDRVRAAVGERPCWRDVHADDGAEDVGVVQIDRRARADAAERRRELALARDLEAGARARAGSGRSQGARSGWSGWRRSRCAARWPGG